MEKRTLVAALMTVWAITSLGAGRVRAVDHRFYEDFSTTTYRDVTHTTVLWDTVAGEIRLPVLEMTVAGSYPGANTAGISVAGDYAYVADDVDGLLVIDISDPTNPTLAGSYNTPNLAREVVVEGNYAYVADRESGLQVLDITDPANPTFAGSYDLPGPVWGLAVDGDYAYLANAGEGLRVMDISDPTNPTLAATRDTPGFTRSVAVDGDYAYMGDGASGLQVIDIKTPTAPTIVGNYDTPGATMGVAISGNRAYLADGVNGLQVVDISDPTAPTLAGSHNTAGNARAVSVDGDYLYLADFASGLVVFDIANPDNPTLIDTYDTAGNTLGVTPEGRYAYVGDGPGGLLVFDIADPVSPTLAGSVDTPATGFGWGVAVVGNYVYKTAYNEFTAIDISNPAAPEVAGSVALANFGYYLDVAGDYAYVPHNTLGLAVIDISDPTTPTVAANWGYTTSHQTLAVAVAGNYAYLADTDSGLVVIDISDPTTPTLAGHYQAPSQAWGVAIEGNHAFVAALTAGLVVVDISDPTTPTYAGSYNTGGAAHDVVIAGNYAFVTEQNNGLEVIDITDPTAPTLAGHYDTPGIAEQVVVEGNYAYISDYQPASGLQVLDISDPAAPTFVGNYPTPYSNNGVAIAGNHVFLTLFSSELHVIEVFERGLLTDQNIGRSLTINAPVGDVVRLSVSSTQAGTIDWHVRADNGAAWQSVTPDGSWYTIDTPGSELVWRSTHVYSSAQPQVNPTCSSLELEWSYDCAIIDSIRDIPNDEGGQVSLFMSRSGYDRTEASDPITIYKLWRRVDTAAMIDEPADQGTVPPGTWALIDSFYAVQQDTYIIPAETVADSSDTVTYSVYHVTAHTNTPSLWYASPPDSGYSVDNIAPGVPTGFGVAYNTGSGNMLWWDDAPEPDVEHFNIYRDSDPGFVPGPANFVDATTATSWQDPGFDTDTVYYKLTALDDVGNESEPAVPEVFNTPPGADVVAVPVDSTTGGTPVTITFDSVSTAGETTLSTSQSGPKPPTAFRLGTPPVYYEIHTTATYVGSVTVCIDYNGQFNNENNIRLFHREYVPDSLVWEDRTASVDTVNNIACARVDGFSIFAVAACHPIIYVDAGAAGTNDGNSWTDAFTELQGALAAASSWACDVEEIWVAKGTYKPTAGSDVTATFQLQNGVALYGGFAGTETLLSERNWIENETILSGDIGTVADSTDNSWHVVTASGTDTTAIMDGFVITGGHAAGTSLDATGAGMLSGNGWPRVRHVTFRANTALLNGAGMFVSGGGHPRVMDVRFEGNVAQSGGGMFVGVGSATLANVVFEGNTAERGGGIYNNATNSVSVTNVTFGGNSADYFGGAIYNSNSHPVVANTIMWGNTSATSPEVHNVIGSTPVISSSLVAGCGGSGGGWDTSLGTDGGNNIDSDAMYRDAVAGDLRAWSSSPAIEAGDNAAVPVWVTTDFAGNPRIYGTDVDMGAYEYQGSPTGIDDEPVPQLPKGLALYQNVPNPFNPTTVIRYDVPHDGARVSLRIYDVTGQLVRTLVDGTVTPGEKSATWDGKNASGNQVTTGVYFYRLTAGGTTLTKKMVLLK